GGAAGGVAAARQARSDLVRAWRQSKGRGVRARAARGFDAPGLRHQAVCMSLRVLHPGLHTLVVDFGRPGSRSLGVPLGGAADRASLILGNALVGNEPNTPALEISLSGPTLRAEAEMGGVVFGAPFDLTTERRTLLVGTTFALQP